MDVDSGSFASGVPSCLALNDGSCGNATLLVTMTDNGQPGSADTIGITLWSKSGGLYYSSQRDGVITVKQLLSGRNLVVH